MMMSSDLHGIAMLLGSKKPSFHCDRILFSSFSGNKVNLLHSKNNAAFGFPSAKFSSVIHRNTTKRFLATSTLANVANDFMVNTLSFNVLNDVLVI